VDQANNMNEQISCPRHHHVPLTYSLAYKNKTRASELEAKTSAGLQAMFWIRGANGSGDASLSESAALTCTPGLWGWSHSLPIVASLDAHSYLLIESLVLYEFHTPYLCALH
jgi:hypothetical protein